jgi:dienelactone hydrolase
MHRYNIPSLIYAMVPFAIFNRFGRTYPTVRGFFSALRRNEASSLPLGAVGFCWGGKHVALLAGDPEGQKLIDAAFTGHPSMLDVPADIKKVRVPVSIAVGDKDNWLSVKQAEQVKEIVEALPDESRGEVVIYPGCGHGFCVRADHLNEDVAKQASEAEDQCIRWFEKHFGSDTTA